LHCIAYCRLTYNKGVPLGNHVRACKDNMFSVFQFIYSIYTYKPYITHILYRCTYVYSWHLSKKKKINKKSSKQRNFKQTHIQCFLYHIFLIFKRKNKEDQIFPRRALLLSRIYTISTRIYYFSIVSRTLPDIITRVFYSILNIIIHKYRYELRYRGRFSYTVFNRLNTHQLFDVFK